MSLPQKIVILGHFGVGKTSLVRQFVESQFSEDYLVTVGVHVKKKELVINHKKVTLILWDIEGNTSVDKARPSYLLGTNGFLYVFDVSRPETYENLQEQITYLNTKFPKAPVTVIANKCDTFNDDLTQHFFETPQFHNCIFTSAKTGENVEEAFIQLTTKLL